MSKLKYIGRFASLALALSVAAVHPALADTIYNATGGAENGGDPLNPTTGAGPVLADRFVSPFSGTLGSVTLNLRLPDTGVGSGFTVDLFSDTGATGPGAVLFQVASVLDSSLSSNFSLLTFSPTSNFQLDGGQSYYIGVQDGGSNAVLGNTLDPNVLGRPDITAGASYYNNGGVQVNAGGPYEISVDASPVPEPASFTLLLTGVGVLGGAVRRRIVAARSV